MNLTSGLGPKIHPQNALIWDTARGEADKVAGFSSVFTLPLLKVGRAVGEVARYAGSVQLAPGRWTHGCVATHRHGYPHLSGPTVYELSPAIARTQGDAGLYQPDPSHLQYIFDKNHITGLFEAWSTRLYVTLDGLHCS
ncbi:MAG: hypothetical protein E6J22_14955 [Chloroflexi bacterium]|nr:MAG: hypothetical protein E6J22_14955 [Chloroflexota bacterium]